LKVIFVPTVPPTVYRHHFFAGAARSFQGIESGRQTAGKAGGKLAFLHHFLHHLFIFPFQNIDIQLFVALGWHPASSTIHCFGLV